MNNFKIFFLIVGAAILSHAAEIGIPIQLKLKSPGGTYPTESGVNFTVAVLSPSSGCILREETFSSQNVVDGSVSLALGSGVLGANDPGLTLVQVYDDSVAKTGLSCVDANNNVISTGQSYTPAVGDRRVIRVSTVLLSDTVIVNFNMRSVPYAVQADAVGGKAASEILVRNTGSQLNQTNLNALLLDATRLSNLLAVASSGTATSAGSFTGSLTGDVSGGQGSTSVDKIKGVPVSSSAPSSGQVLQFNGTQYVPTNMPSATVTSVAGRTGAVTLSNSDISGLGSAATLNAGSSSGNLVQLDGSGKIPSAYLPAVSGTVANLDGDVSGTTAASVVVAVGGKSSSDIATAVNDVQGASSANSASTIVKRDASGNFSSNIISSSSNSTLNLYLFDSTNSIRLRAPSGLGSNLVLTLPSGNGSGGQFLQTDGSGNLSWASVSSSGGTVNSVTASAPLSSSGGVNPNISISVGTASGTVAAGDDSRITGALQAADYNADVAGAASCSNTQTPYWDSIGDAWACMNISFPADAVTSVAGRTGAVTLTSSDISGLGSAASQNVGAAAGNVVQLDGTAKIPAGLLPGSLVTSVSATSPLSSSGGATPSISISQASGSSAGYLSSADWNTFNNKQAALGFTPLNAANNLSDVASSSTARVNLGLGSAAELNAGTSPNNLVQLDAGSKIPVSTLPNSVVTSSSALAGDVSGTLSTTSIVTVGGKTSSQIAASVNDTVSATSVNTASTIVKRNASGDVAVGVLSAASVSSTSVIAVNVNANAVNASTVSATSVSSSNSTSDNVFLRSGANTINLKAPAGLGSNLTLNLPSNNGSAGQVLLTDGAGNLSWANVSAAGGTVSTVTASAPLSSSGGANPNISLTQASGSAAGYLSSADWTTFNNKQAALGFTPVDVSAYNADLAPAASCTSSQTAYWNTVSDTWACQAISFPVTSVAGRTGAVTLTSSDISGLGTAAVLNAGASASNVVQLDGTARIPASTLPTNAVTTSTALSGDVTGTVSTVSVDKIRGVAVDPTAPLAGQALVFDGTNWVPAYGVPSFSRKTANQTFSATAVANVTSLAFPVAAGVTYKYKFHILYTSVSTNTGLRVGLTYPAVTTASGLANIASGADGTGAYYQGVLNTSGDSVMAGNSPTTSANGMFAFVEGVIVPSAAGTVQLTAATETAGNNIVIRAGSFVEYSVVP